MALDPRAAAALVIGEVLSGKSLNQALPARLAMVAERERGLLQQLCYATLRHQPRLSALLAPLLNRPLKARDNDVLGLLLCGLCQLENTRIPDHAAVAATVGATAALKKSWARGMVNAVLRRFLRERSALFAGLDPAAAASHPRWLYDALAQQWPAAADEVIAANNQQPPMVLRVNRAQISRPDYLAILAEQGIEARPGILSPQAVYLAQACDVSLLPGFATGQVSVQDEAAQLAAPLLEPQPGERILDACSAPGGKACHLLELEPKLAELVAMDVDEARLGRVAENLARLQLQATLLVGDAEKPVAIAGGTAFDRILVDAPCSASGVIRRHPDIKVLRRAEDIGRMAAQQLCILNGLWPLLKPGGTLLYATCSVLEAENSAVVHRFLTRQDDARLQPVEATWGQPMDCGRQLLPTADGPDGLFYALLRKSP